MTADMVAPTAQAGASSARTGPSTATSSRQRPAWRIFAGLLPFLWPAHRPGLRLRVVLALVAMVASKVIIVYVPFFYKGAVDALGSEEGREAALIAVPIFLVLAYGVARILGLLFGEVQDALYARVSEAMQRGLGLRIFDHVNTLSLRFHLERKSGGLQRIMGRGLYLADSLLQIVLFRILPSTIEFVFVAAILTSVFGVVYALITGVTVAVYLGATFAISEWRKKFRRTMIELDSAAHAQAMDALLNFETVKYFNNERHEARRYDGALDTLETAKVRTTASLSLLNTVQNVIFIGGLTVLMLMAGMDVAAGTLTVGDFVMINALVIQLGGPLNNYGFVYRTIQEALIDAERMLDILDMTPEVKDKPGAEALRVTGPTIAFENVDFHYAPERKILHDVSFTVPAGRTVGIVGPTGAGKSTLSRLLFRFYDAVDGRITIDGQDIRDVTQESLRKAIGMVPQDTVLFNDTIGYNIAYGRPGATQEEIERAAGLAQLHDFVARLPLGYDTVVGERGLKLSGGEKQRVAIARTLLKDPPILMLDEATSSLDSRTEADIQTALRTVSDNRTTLMIAHRLSTVMHADEILVIDDGRIVERGRHGDLLAAGGMYAGLWRQQVEAQDEEAQHGEAPDREGGEGKSETDQRSAARSA
ncbi:MAG: ABCB family ABC transporter ATP-binding protein/permease [Alphaproteobacteria bacterium]